jgi:hypothetical protein
MLINRQAPLYRRHTWAYELLPLQPADYPAFFPTYDAEQIVEAFAVLGGMPRNLVAVSADARLMQNVERELLSPAGSLFNEARWRSAPVTARDLESLVEKGLLWLRGDTSRWDVHYAFFARGFGEQLTASAGDEDNVHLFTAQELVGA